MKFLSLSAFAALAFALSSCASAIHSAALRGQTDVVEAELNKGADINGRFGLAKFTPLMAAASSGNAETVNLLLKRGADPTLKASNGKTAADWIEIQFNGATTARAKQEVAALLQAAGLETKTYARSPAPQMTMMSPSAPGNLDDAAYGRMRAAANLPPPPAAAPAPASDVDSPPSRGAARPDDFALVIGIEEYQSVPKADYGVRDARTVRKHLEALGFPPRNIISLEGSQATGSKLRSYLEEWLPLNVKPTSTLFVYYSGHGAPDAKSGDAYLVPWDGDPKFLKSTALPLKKFYSDLAKTKAKRVIVALDACFSGAGGRSVLAQGARPLVAKVAELAPAAGNLTVLAAASGDEITGTLQEQSHGLFTYYLLKALAANPKASAQALFDDLKPRVQDDARRDNREQTPVLAGAAPGPLLP